MNGQRVPAVAPEQRSPEASEFIGSYTLGAVPNVIHALAHHPRAASRWTRFNGHLLASGLLPARERELAILRTVWRCRAAYEWGHHVVFGLEIGLAPDEIERVAAPTVDGWSGHEAALLRAVDELHDDAQIAHGTWTTLATTFDDAQLIELCMLVGSYHLASYVTRSLEIELDDGLPEMPVDESTRRHT